MTRWTFTCESVTEGHPDKMADQVSDAVLDAILTEDPDGRVACETLLTTGLCVVAGEITTNAYVDIPKIAREIIKDIGYDNALFGFDGNTCGVIVSIDEQSPNIAQGVDKSEELRGGKAGEDQINAQGAGDQGMMFGYACDETPDLMPLPIWLAHRLAERLSEVRKSGQLPYLRPDGKTQVTFDYEDGRPVALKAVLISTQHQDGIDRDTRDPPGSDRAGHPSRRPRAVRAMTTTTSTSTRPATSWSAARTATPASPAARSSSTPTAAWAATVAARSVARIRARSTARPPTPRGGSPSTWSPAAPPTVARCRSPTRSAWRIR